MINYSNIKTGCSPLRYCICSVVALLCVHVLCVCVCVHVHYIIIICSIFCQSNHVLNCSHCLKATRDRLERFKETLEAEKPALDKQVRELTFKLEVRTEDLYKKEVGRQQDQQLSHENAIEIA